MKEKIKLAIIEDDLAYRKFLVNLFSKRKDIQIVSEISNGKEFIKTLKFQVPDILLMGLEAPAMNGFETASYLDKRHPEIKILILTVYREDITLLDLIEIGVNGFVFKNKDNKEILKAVYSLNDHKYYLDEIDLKNVFNARKNSSISVYSGIIKFSVRELEIIKFLCDGLTQKEISDKLFVGTKTIDWHINNAMKKTGIKTRRKFIIFAKDKGLNHMKNDKVSIIQTIKKISAGDKKFEKELIEITIRQTTDYIEKIGSFLKSDNWIELKRMAHKMQSTFIIFDLKNGIRLSDVLIKTSGDNIKKTTKEVTQVISICHQIIEELESYTV